jgi:Ser-tRNA(Ala) deacylase AlaX
MTTRLRYLEEMDRLELTSQVVAVDQHDGREVVILDETIFYPQGGGQPYDQGTIESSLASFNVEEVRFIDGVVRHIGTFRSGKFDAGTSVTSRVAAERRSLHSRVHSAGHVVDMAVTALGLDWIPGKGYHFPEGPYVEYTGAFDRDVEILKKEIETNASAIGGAGIETYIRFVSAEDLRQLCRFVPDNLPAGKPIRIVFYGDFGVPCGGTHVAKLGDIGSLTIRKLKKSGDVIRVSYAVA